MAGTYTHTALVLNSNLTRFVFFSYQKESLDGLVECGDTEYAESETKTETESESETEIDDNASS